MPHDNMNLQLDRFAKFAWGVLGYLLLVILWGAFVRATGSGAGCGAHWPLCNGEVIPRAPEIETLIELSHRITSAFAGVLIIILVIWGFKNFPKGHVVRFGAVGTLVFVITEGLIGALIVLLGWVAYDDSIMRTISIALHLNNTFILVAFSTLTAWWASGGAPFNLKQRPPWFWMLAGIVIAVMLISTAGAITALGDTLFKVDTVGEAISRKMSATAHHLERLRALHPLFAVLLTAVLYWGIRSISDRLNDALTTRLGQLVLVLYIVQLGLGTLNIYLKAPVWMQLVHLLMADFIWIALILFAATAIATWQSEPLVISRSSLSSFSSRPEVPV